MFKYTLLAAAAAANELHLIEATPSNSIYINQISGTENFVMSSSTKADPDPVRTNNRQYFNVSGYWVDAIGAYMDKVELSYNIQGVQVFKEDFPCTTGSANCPLPTGTVGERWNGSFYFDVQANAPHYLYDLHIIAYSGALNLWELNS